MQEVEPGVGAVVEGVECAQTPVDRQQDGFFVQLSLHRESGDLA